MPLRSIPQIDSARPLATSSIQGLQHGVRQKHRKVIGRGRLKARIFHGQQTTKVFLDDHADPTFAASVGGGGIKEEVCFQGGLGQGQAAKVRLDQGRRFAESKLAVPVPHGSSCSLAVPL